MVNALIARELSGFTFTNNELEIFNTARGRLIVCSVTHSITGVTSIFSVRFE